MTKAKVITITYQKGGTGKTTLAVNLAAYLANYDQKGKLNRKSEDKLKVLLIDLDPHSNSTKYLQLYEEDSPTFLDLVTGKKQDITDTLYIYEGNTGIGTYEIHCMRSCEELNSINIDDFEDKSTFYMKLDSMLKESGALDYYDYIIIDCPPATKELYGNGIYAGDYFLCPTTIRGADYEELTCTLNEINRFKNPKKETKLLGVVINMQIGKRTTAEVISKGDNKTIDTDDIDVVEMYRQDAPVYDEMLPSSVAINNSYIVQEPLISYFYYRTSRRRGGNANRAFINLVNAIYNDMNYIDDKDSQKNKKKFIKKMKKMEGIKNGLR